MTSFAGAFPFVFVCRPNWCSITTELTLESIRVRSGKESAESGPWGCEAAVAPLLGRPAAPTDPDGRVSVVVMALVSDQWKAMSVVIALLPSAASNPLLLRPQVTKPSGPPSVPPPAPPTAAPSSAPPPPPAQINKLKLQQPPSHLKNKDKRQGSSRFNATKNRELQKLPSLKGERP